MKRNRFTGRTALPLALGILVALCAPLAGAAPAAGNAAANRLHGRLAAMDSNGDGRVSLAEYLAAADAQFKAIDSANKGSIDAADIASSPQAIERIDRRAGHVVARLDSAGNGYVTLDEFVAVAQKRFARLDANGDGKLTAEELATPRGRRAAKAPGAGAGQYAAKRFAKLDANHDGVVTLDEYVASAKALFGEFDARHDGKVTADEIATSPRAEARATHVAEHLVRRMDSNGDGRVSHDEFIAAAKARFARLDRNGDGFLDAAEFASGWGDRSHRHGA